jgi:eukaryotic-like serine/threonine-protein kinase
MSLSSGSKLGPYEIVSVLGAGGMGVVYRARDTRLGRDVALKVLPDDVAGDAQRLERFEHEARAAAALNHPNIAAVFDAGREGAVRYVVHELLEGETLRERLRRGPLAPREALDTAAQVARGLAAAHAKGIVHRDVKPENVFVTRDGHLKVLDFGLAKVRAPVETEAPTAAALTQPGEVLGTVSYMSPEQLRGSASVDARSDVFSLGVLLFELLAGKRPFDGASAAETASRILTSEPPGLALDPSSVPKETEAIVRRALAKSPEARYADAAPFAAALETARDEVDFRVRLARGGGFRLPRGAWIAFGVALACAATAGALLWLRHSRRAWAQAAVPRASRLAQEGKWAEAFNLVRLARRELPGDAALATLLPEVTDILRVTTEPAGARVFVRRFEPERGPDGGETRDLGLTPLWDVEIARGDYVLRLEKEGFEPFERTISSALPRVERHVGAAAIRISWALRKAGTVPPGSAFVPGGMYKLVGFGQPTAASVPLREYFIDRYEVSNREYAEFVAGGGYRQPEFWTQPIRDEGRTLSFEDAMRRLVDRTGLPGPRGWTGGTFPDGKADHPVAGVSWYEADAYARFRGKRLPTIFQWEKAARDGVYTVTSDVVMPWGLQRGADPRANFDGKGTVPVRQAPFGMGPYGVFHMAGNVSEWTRNAAPGGFVTAGGAFTDPPYLFGDYGILPGLASFERIGFRCALASAGPPGEEGDAPISRAEQAPIYPRSSRAQFEEWLSHYRYDRTPPEGRVEERIEAPDWTREHVSFLGAGGVRIQAWLYLPKSARPPYQVIQFVPGSNVYAGEPVPAIAEGDHLAPFVKAGRALFIVSLPGYPGRERPPGYQRPAGPTVAFRQRAVAESIDIRRGIDYLETRSDIDPARIAFMNASISSQGILFSAVEPRYRGVVLMSDGLYPEQAAWIPEANPVNFAPHIRPPKLMVNGRWDEDFAFKTEAEPLFKLLSEPKSLHLFDGGHIPPPEVLVPTANVWLDRTLGPVAR